MPTNYLEIRKLAKMLANAGISFFFQELTNGYSIICFGIIIRELGDVNLSLPSYGEGADRLSVSFNLLHVDAAAKTFFQELASEHTTATKIFLLLQGLHEKYIWVSNEEKERNQECQIKT